MGRRLHGHEGLDQRLLAVKVQPLGGGAQTTHVLAGRQMKGAGGMITFVLRGGLEPSRRFLEALEVFACAESRGGVESLIEHPAIMTHASIPADVRAKAGIDDGLIRLSVGIEDVVDLQNDLDQALR